MQNADDAGATCIKFFVAQPADSFRHGESSLFLHKGFQDFSGPALYAFNDAKFSEPDFKAIRNIGKSSKQSDASKTGKFGLGFNAVYHFTDLPSFVTGSFLVIMDPHQRMLLGRDGERAFARRWNFVCDPTLRKYQGHKAWFDVAGHSCDFCENFPGTMFRFPLRTPEHARYSELSKETWSLERMNLGSASATTSLRTQPCALSSGAAEAKLFRTSSHA